MTIAATVDLGDGRRTRVFARDADHVAELGPLARTTFMDDGDRAREPALREMLNEEIVYVDAHAGVEPADALHVFIRKGENSDAERIFACVIVTDARLEKMLEAEPRVVETFSFQVSSGRIVTPASTIAAFETWFEGRFPNMRLPVICFEHITGSVETFGEGDLSDIRQEASEAELPTSFEDVGSLVAA